MSGLARQQPAQEQSQRRRPADMPREVFDEALRAGLDARADAQGTRARGGHPWTPEIDAEILRANRELRLGARPIAAVLKATYGWGSRSAVEDRLAKLRAAGK